MSSVSASLIKTCLSLTQAISRAESPDDIYTAALDALAQALTVTRAAVLLFDPDGVMRFKAWRGLSGTYRTAVEGHSPWTPDTPDAQPIVVGKFMLYFDTPRTLSDEAFPKQCVSLAAPRPVP